jgi:hypothetical protein
MLWRFPANDRSAADAGLAVFLCAALGVLPVLPEVHVAFAGHEHLYCAEHQRIEDVYAERQATSGQQYKEPSLVADARSTHFEGTPCAVCNPVQSPWESGALGFSLFAPSSLHILPKPSAQAAAPADPLAHAPKHSPPVLHG